MPPGKAEGGIQPRQRQHPPPEGYFLHFVGYSGCVVVFFKSMSFPESDSVASAPTMGLEMRIFRLKVSGTVVETGFATKLMLLPLFVHGTR
jgi:hypothetical protein